MLANRREALMLLEERISEFVEYHEVPLHRWQWLAIEAGGDQATNYIGGA